MPYGLGVPMRFLETNKKQIKSRLIQQILLNSGGFSIFARQETAKNKNALNES